MAKCDLCGEETGDVGVRHAECQAAHDSGEAEILKLGTAVALSGGDVSEFARASAEKAGSSFILEDELRGLYVHAWEEAVRRVLEWNVFTDAQEASLMQYISQFSLDQQDLDRHGAYTDVVKAGILRDLLEDRIPDRVTIQGELPFNLQGGEALLWFYNDVGHYQGKPGIPASDRHPGAGVQVGKGVLYRVEGARECPVATGELNHIADGQLGITSGSIYFAGADHEVQVRHGTAAAFAQYSDGFGLQQADETAGMDVFVTGDGWFAYNLVMNLAKLVAR